MRSTFGSVQSWPEVIFSYNTARGGFWLNGHKDDDAALVRAYQKDRSERAFAEIYRRHVRPVAATLRPILRNDADLGEVVQETFLKAALNIHKIKEPEKLRSWLITIGIRTARAWQRKFLRRRELAPMVNPKESPGVVQPKAHSELYVAAVLDTLSFELRTPWVLHKLHAHTIENTAKLCAVSVSTAQRRIRRADELLKKRVNND